MAASRLQLEITETVLMHNTFATLATLHQLRKLGVQIAMDDFGTGYSSLSYLRSFPFDKIKIDRSFIQDLSNGAEPLAIVHAVAGLARSLNMISTAEGVETQQQLDQLQSVGCTEMQGYLFISATRDPPPTSSACSCSRPARRCCRPEKGGSRRVVRATTFHRRVNIYLVVGAVRRYRQTYLRTASVD
jgi:EAL domain-containing protein (putative c-di-GMP-specific phosphodiesterase class I)